MAPSTPTVERAAAGRLLRSALGFGIAVALAIGAAHWYEVPRLAGAASHSVWAERDLQCSLASGLVALTIGILEKRPATSATAAASRSPFLRALIWAAFTLVLLALWASSLGLFALLIAPTHALAGLRLIGLWSKWRSDVQWNRAR